jgi:hypothetical protein
MLYLARRCCKQAGEERQMTKEKQAPQPKDGQERKLSKELEMSFPASDPPASTQPGSGITGPEVIKPTPTKAR